MSIFKNKDIKPMLLTETSKPFNDKNYIFELKFDGIRTLIYISKNNIIIKSRNQLILNDLFPELLDIKNNFKTNIIFDGEIVVLKDGKPSFSSLQKRLHIKNKNKINKLKKEYPATFICFDILYETKDLTNLKLIKRKEILNKYKDTKEFIKTIYYKENGINLFNAVKEMNLEGIVAKNINSTYQINTRSNDWIKIKNLKDDDFYICGYLEKENVASLLLGEKKDNKYIYVGKVTIGKKRNEFRIIKKCKITKNNLTNFNDKNYIFINPSIKCTVNFLERTNNNSLRHPVFKCLKM